ncbi:MAG TPA: molybdopterin-binding protein, partial [Aggregatilineales bacterium]|nr:molybdopterin-binding protein [Aggregatilineales bacterium]
MTHERNVYLEDIPLDDARAALYDALRVLDRLKPLDAERVALREALGRVTAQPVLARISAPHFHASAMDGYAVRASDTLNATETRPLTLPADRVQAVNTGTPLPAWSNAVIMIENVQETPDGIVISAPVAPWQHVRLMGEDMVATEMVLAAGHTIRPVDLGAIAGCGHASVDVHRKPHVVIIPTGSELVTADREPQSGQIIEYNSLVLAAQIEARGGRVTILPIQPDDRDALKAALRQALDLTPDLLLMLSGSSAGSHDFTASVIKDNGRLLVHGVAVRPGHP